jgi:hypothetical protein
LTIEAIFYIYIWPRSLGCWAAYQWCEFKFLWRGIKNVSAQKYNSKTGGLNFRHMYLHVYNVREDFHFNNKIGQLLWMNSDYFICFHYDHICCYWNVSLLVRLMTGKYLLSTTNWKLRLLTGSIINVVWFWLQHEKHNS